MAKDQAKVKQSVMRSRAGRDINVINISLYPPAHPGEDGSTPTSRTPDENTRIGAAKESPFTDKTRRCLVVLIHGLYGDPDSSWPKMVDSLKENATQKFALYSFGYPAGLCQRASLDSAAEDLKLVLTESLPPYENYVFVCHSAGGIVLKKALVADARKCDATLDHSIIRRTRCIVNIGVPHHGASRSVAASAIASYKVFRCITAVPFAVSRRLSLGRLNLGKNEIIGQLSFGNPSLVKLEEDFAKRIDRMRMDGFPVPDEIDFVGRNDLVIAESPAREPVHLNVDHTGGKDAFILGFRRLSDGHADKDVAPVAAEIAKTIDKAWNWWNFVANHTVIHTTQLDRMAAVRDLFAGDEGSSTLR